MTLKIPRVIVRETPKILSATKITINGLLKLRVVNYELNLELQFSKTLAESNFEIFSY